MTALPPEILAFCHIMYKVGPWVVPCGIRSVATALTTDGTAFGVCTHHTDDAERAGFPLSMNQGASS